MRPRINRYRGLACICAAILALIGMGGGGNERDEQMTDTLATEPSKFNIECSYSGSKMLVLAALSRTALSTPPESTATPLR